MSLPKLGHLRALDGIRGIAVAIVVLHHLKVPWIHAGWLGVDLFFALSGFLITQSVLGTGDGSSLWAFWKRRAWRLGPAMAVLLGWYLAISRNAPDRSLRMSWLFASAGQYLDIHDASSRHGPFSPHLGHLWSLSMEVQFYVVWPLLLMLLLRRHVGRAGILAAPTLLLTSKPPLAIHPAEIVSLLQAKERLRFPSGAATPPRCEPQGRGLSFTRTLGKLLAGSRRDVQAGEGTGTKKKTRTPRSGAPRLHGRRSENPSETKDTRCAITSLLGRLHGHTRSAERGTRNGERKTVRIPRFAFRARLVL